MTIRGIARLLGVSAPTVLQWLRKEAPKSIQKPEAGDVEAMQFDEVGHFLGQKKRKRWVWLALDSDSKRILDWEIGVRSAAILKRLFQRVRHGSAWIYWSDNR